MAAQYGITISLGVAAAMGGTASKSGNPEAVPKDKRGKALPKTGGVNVGSLLGLGAGVALIGSGLVAYRRGHRRS